MDRQHGEIGIVAGQHDLVYRRPHGRHFDRRNGMAQALAQHGGKAGLVGFQRGCEPPPRAHHVADELGPFRSDGTKPDRVGIAIERRGDIDEINRLVVHDAFTLLRQLLDEVSQAEFFAIGLDHDATSNTAGVIRRS